MISGLTLTAVPLTHKVAGDSCDRLYEGFSSVREDNAHATETLARVPEHGVLITSSVPIGRRSSVFTARHPRVIRDGSGGTGGHVIGADAHR